MNLYKGLVSVLFALSTSVSVAAAEVPKVVSSAFNTTYMPQGFDTNDKVQIVGEGLFPNSCYRKAGVKVNVNHTLKTIRVTPTAYKYDGMCMQMVIPYDSVVDVGILKAGAYKLIQGYSGETLGEINVRVSTNAGPDDFLYAPISQAFVTQVGNTLKVKIAGEYPDSCMEMQEVITDVQEKVIVVQPIAVRTDEGVRCAQALVPFERTVEIKNVPQGKYLLHVRSLNGNAINNLFLVR